MPFLWNPAKNQTEYPASPSPKQKNSNGNFIKKASALFSQKVNAGMTVEASMVLPFFLFVFISLGSLFEMMRLHNNLQLALWNVGNKIGMYGYLKNPFGEDGDKNSSVADEIKDLFFTYGYVKEEMILYAGRDYLENSPLTYGCQGIQFWESDLFTTEDTMDIVVTYQVSPGAFLPTKSEFRLFNRYYGHLWTGYQLPAGNAATVRDPVYVTKYGTVYHEKKECSYLNIKVKTVSEEILKELQNQSGEHYVLCKICGSKARGEYFVTDSGACYHSSEECPGLSRTIYVIERRQAAHYRKCSRCG